MGYCRIWVRISFCLLFCILTPAVSIRAEQAVERTGAEETKASTPVSVKKAARKVNKGKKPDLNDPARLKEIAEKSILAVQSGDDGGNLDLPVKGRISSTVGLRPDPINGDIRMHNGVDIAIAEGTPVKPVASGRVAYSGMQPGYGNMVIIQHDDGMISIYAHHSRNMVKTRDKVGKETVIAFSGSTGHSTGPHLHFEAWQAGMNVTNAFLPRFAGSKVEESTHESLEKTNLRKVILSDGTILFIELVNKKVR